MSGTPAEIAAKFRELGANPSVLAIEEIYWPLVDAVPKDGVVVRSDMPYGDHPRHRLDVYHPASLDAGAKLPVLLWIPSVAKVLPCYKVFAELDRKLSQ